MKASSASLSTSITTTTTTTLATLTFCVGAREEAPAGLLSRSFAPFVCSRLSYPSAPALASSLLSFPAMVVKISFSSSSSSVMPRVWPSHTSHTQCQLQVSKGGVDVPGFLGSCRTWYSECGLSIADFEKRKSQRGIIKMIDLLTVAQLLFDPPLRKGRRHLPTGWKIFPGRVTGKN